MKKFYTHIYFWLAAFSIIVFGNISILNISDTIVINSHDTYYVVSRSQVSYVFGFSYMLIGCIYWLFQKINFKLNQNLVRFHTIGSVGTVLLYFVFLIYYSYFKTESLFESSYETYINLILVFTTLLVQIHFIYNIIDSFIKHKSQRETPK